MTRAARICSCHGTPSADAACLVALQGCTTSPTSTTSSSSAAGGTAAACALGRKSDTCIAAGHAA